MERLQDLSQSELQDLLDNAERVDVLALESDEVQNVQLEREMALASNRNLAERNLELKPRLESGRAVLVERYAELEGVKARYQQHCDQRDCIAGQVSPEALFSQLQVEGVNTEAESEVLAEEFLDGSLPLDSFLDRFLSLRSLAHRRRVRIEKLQEILRQKKEGGGDLTSPTSRAMTSQAHPNLESGAGLPLPWQSPQPQQPQHKNDHGSNANNISYPNVVPSHPGPALPYTPYPAAHPNPVPAVLPTGPVNRPSQFTAYPSQAPPFPPGSGFGLSSCPYPAHPAFPGAPGPQFGQYNAPQLPYPSPYPYPTYSYPIGPSLPSSESSTGRPGFGVPQPYT